MVPLSLPHGPLRVLCIAAHPDDIEIGCGATLLELAATRRARVHNVVLSGTAERHEEAARAAELFLGGSLEELVTHSLPDGRLPAHWAEVKAILESVATRVRPDLILAPRVDDAHQDHRLLGSLVTTVWRDALVLRYEIPKWDGDLGRPTHYVPVTPEVARRKVELLATAYPSQTERDWWGEELFLGLMRVRGVECRSAYAEAFFVDKALLTVGGTPGAEPEA
ncbi:PIG-L family deacetylase [Terrabacter aerolatus]|uniref:GlcNAc-PI de-N-acetylase n=1 Tax=Terrabacter aerolatus TaxID=422442 RepID=A0A512D3N1_9MICO|nr:PIG-L deacetylase family protein [Terrabacter aerolatus]GEO31085.1 GlcNAc-PI de-N-acetylase [Terrabacter aerolatus]